MKTLIIDNAEPDSDFNQPLVDVISKFSKLEVVNFRDMSAEVATEFDAIVLSGVPIDYSFETIRDRHDRLTWMRAIKKPMLGICLGHQVLGTMFGSRILRSEPERGHVRISVFIQDDSLFKNIDASFMANALHDGSINLPDGFIQLASSKGCTNQIMKHKKQLIYGIQFHPEQYEPTHALIGNFIEMAKVKEMALSASTI